MKKLYLCVLLLILGACVTKTNDTDASDYRDPRFSPDGKSIIFDRCSKDYPEWCRIHVYNLETGTLGYYLPPPGQSWAQGYFSDAGDKIVFVTMPAGDHTKDIYSQRNDIFPKAQIAIMDKDGSNMRVLTDTVGYKGMPALSHSGKKVIFAQAEQVRNSGMTVAAHWDLWELDLETGKLGLFAGHFRFYQMGLSTYFADDQRVLLNGDSPKSQLDALTGSFSSRLSEYNKRYKNSGVFVVRRGSKELEVPLFTDFSFANGACLDASENMYFEATGVKEGTRFRRSGRDGHQISWPPPTLGSAGGTFMGTAIAPDGLHLALSVAYGEMSDKNIKLMLLDTTSGIWQEIELPQQAKPIAS
ncbi:MAG: hypothetical protein R8K20_02065 [Gallionellaceae bacterium]